VFLQKSQLVQRLPLLKKHQLLPDNTIAAEIVAFFLIKFDFSRNQKKSDNVFLRIEFVKVCAYIKTAGITPLAPLVGAVMILPDASSSFTDKQETH
jgi:hypothetical protein